MKCLVLGLNNNEWHELTVKDIFLEHTTDWDCDIAMAWNANHSFPNYSSNVIFTISYTEAVPVPQLVQFGIDQEYDMIIMSYGGLWAYRDAWNLATENEILVVLPLGSNSQIQLTNPPRLYSPIVVSGGDPSNERSWGNGLELLDHPESLQPDQSWATPRAAARAAELLKTLSLWDTRSIIRRSCANYPNWDNFDGYGKLEDPTSLIVDLQPPVDINVQNIFGTAFGLTWRNFETSNFDHTEIELNDQLIYEGTDNFKYFLSKMDGTATFKFYTADENERSELRPHSERTTTLFVHPFFEIEPQRNGNQVTFQIPRIGPGISSDVDVYKNGSLFTTIPITGGMEFATFNDTIGSETSYQFIARREIWNLEEESDIFILSSDIEVQSSITTSPPELITILSDSTNVSTTISGTGPQIHSNIESLQIAPPTVLPNVIPDKCDTEGFFELFVTHSVPYEKIYLFVPVLERAGRVVARSRYKKDLEKLIEKSEHKDILKIRKINA